MEIVAPGFLIFASISLLLLEVIQITFDHNKNSRKNVLKFLVFSKENIIFSILLCSFISFFTLILISYSSRLVGLSPLFYIFAVFFTFLSIFLLPFFESFSNFSAKFYFNRFNFTAMIACIFFLISTMNILLFEHSAKAIILLINSEYIYESVIENITDKRIKEDIRTSWARKTQHDLAAREKESYVSIFLDPNFEKIREHLSAYPQGKFHKLFTAALDSRNHEVYDPSVKYIFICETLQSSKRWAGDFSIESLLADFGARMGINTHLSHQCDEKYLNESQQKNVIIFIIAEIESRFGYYQNPKGGRQDSVESGYSINGIIRYKKMDKQFSRSFSVFEAPPASMTKIGHSYPGRSSAWEASLASGSLVQTLVSVLFDIGGAYALLEIQSEKNSWMDETVSIYCLDTLSNSGLVDSDERMEMYQILGNR
ncbi:MAG: hypothetical protein ACMVY4_06030 [Minwuia sp.]|uniref:hypothetical protein n=1 Tax=Minwuia sp. TaxID=2493630 RepID=UPI003A85812A